MIKQQDRDRIMTEGEVQWHFPFDPKKEPYYCGGIAHYGNLSVSTLKVLVEKGYAEPEECQHEGKTIAEMMEFMEKFPELKAEGYVVEEKRHDFRLTVTGLTFKGKSPQKLRDEFEKFFSDADEYQNNDSGLRSWYD